MNCSMLVDNGVKRVMFGFSRAAAILWVLFLFLFGIITAIPCYAQELEQPKGNETKLESMSLEQLLNIEVTTAGKKAEKVGDIPASVVVITRKDIETYGYQSLSEILENIPGLYKTDDYASTNFGVRGYWTADPQRDFIILVNDVMQSESLLGASPLELFAIPVEAIDRIEVVRGPMSVIYGTGAFFGAINIFTNKIDRRGPVSFVAASLGSDNTKKITLRASGKGEDYQYTFNASLLDTDGMNKDLSKMGSFQGMTGKKLERTEKYLNFSGTFNGFTFDASYSQENKESYILLPSYGDGSSIIWRAFHLNFGYQHHFSDKVKLAAKLGYSFNNWLFDYIWDNPDFYGTQTNRSAGYRGELNLFVEPAKEVKMTFGLNYASVPDVLLEYTVPAFFTNHIKNSLEKGDHLISQALFAQVDFKLSKRFLVVSGIRLDQTPAYTIEKKEGSLKTGIYSSDTIKYSHKKIEFIPRLALIYSIDKKNFLKFLYGKAINRPSFFQTADFINYQPKNNKTEFSPDELTAETIQTLELNYTGNLTKKLFLSVSLFRNLLDKLIVRTLYDDNDTFFTYQGNLGKMKTIGTELTVRYSPTRDFQVELSGTYQDTKEERLNIEDDIPGYSPKFLSYINASYFFNNDVSVALTANYVSSMESYYDSATNTPGRLGDKVDGCFLLGANFRARNLFDTGLFLNIRGSNLLNQEVRYPTTSNNYKFIKKGTIGRGISFLVTLGWKF